MAALLKKLFAPTAPPTPVQPPISAAVEKNFLELIVVCETKNGENSFAAVADFMLRTPLSMKQIQRLYDEVLPDYRKDDRQYRLLFEHVRWVEIQRGEFTSTFYRMVCESHAELVRKTFTDEHKSYINSLPY